MILQPLSELLPKHYEPGISREPITPFFAEFKGKVYTVKSVLERTAVLMNTEDFYDRRLGKLTEVLVDPAIISWRADTGSRFTDGGQPDPAGKARLRGRVASQVAKAAKRVNYAFVGGLVPISEDERAALRVSGDQRALQDQARHKAKPPTPAKVKRTRLSLDDARARARVTANERYHKGVGDTKRCPSCDRVKARSAFPEVGRGSPSCLECRGRTHCREGHALTPENTVNIKRWRACRTCVNEAQCGYRAANRRSEGAIA